MKKRKLLYLFPLAALVLSGCDIQEVMDNAKNWATDKIVEPVKDILPWTNKEDQPEEEGQKPSGEEQHHEEEKPAPKEFEGLTLESATFTYDGQPHSISVSGTLPEGASVDYGTAGHEFTEVGEHTVTAVVSAEGYNSLTLTATVTIVKAHFSEEVQLVGASFVYDGEEHKIEVSGAPENAEISYPNGNAFTNVGEYEVTALVSAHGYESLELSATLTITKANFEGIVFENQTVTYDGQEHSLEPTVPEKYVGAQISYGDGGNKFTAVGTHQIDATVSLENYNDWTGTAYLTIAPAAFAGLSLNNKTVTYNGEKQTIELDGELPDFATATYVEGKDGGTLPGEYQIEIVISAEGYDDLVLKATLTIEAATFEGIEFKDATFVYDGVEHKLVPTVPAQYQGAEIAYGEGGNALTDVGELTVEVTVSLEGYNDWHGSAKLTITSAEFENITLEDKSIAYDGGTHTIEVQGTLPEGTTVEYLEGQECGPEPGTYPVKVRLTNPNYTTKDLSATLTIVFEQATEPLMVEDFENITNNSQLISNPYAFEYWSDSGWAQPTSATAKLANNQKIGNGTNTLKLNTYHNGTAFKFTKNIDAPTKSYNGFAIDTFVDDYVEGGTTTIKLQLWFIGIPFPDTINYQGFNINVAGYRNDFYITWELEADVNSNWTHWEIPFEDDGILVNGDKSSNLNAYYKTALELMDLTLADLVRYIDHVSVLVNSPLTGNGPATTCYVDNIQLINVENRLEEQHIDLANRVYTLKSSDETVFKLSLKENNAAELETLNLENNIALPVGSYSLIGDDLTVTAQLGGGETATIKAKVTNDGKLLKITEDPSASNPALLADLAPHLAGFNGNKFAEVISMDDFESYSETGIGYDRDHTEAEMSGLRATYYGEHYNDQIGDDYAGLIEKGKWKLISTTNFANYIKLDSGIDDGHAMSMTNNADSQFRYMNYSLAKGRGQSFGRGTTFSFYAKGSAAQTLKVKVYYVDQITSSNQGDSTSDHSMGTFELTTDWQRFEIQLNPSRDVMGVMITPVKKSGVYCRAFVDNMEIFGEGNPYAEYVAPALYEEISDGLYGVELGGNLYSLRLSDSVTSAVLEKDGQSLGAFTAQMAEGKVTIEDTESGGKGLTVEFTIDQGTLVVSNASGTQAGDFAGLLNAVLVKVATLNYNFDGLSHSDLNDSNWIQQYRPKAGGNWTSMSGNMRVRVAANNPHGNLAVGNNNEMRYTYAPEGGIGLANSFSVDIANDYSGCTNISYKMSLVLKDDSEVFVAGDENTYEVINANTGDRANNQWVHISEDLNGLEVKAVRINLISEKGTNSYDYFYFDNLKVEYKLPEQPTPQTQYANINYGFEDRSAGDVSLSDSTWYQDKKDGSSYVALGTSQFKVISSNSGNKFSCMIGGWSQVRRFAYTPTSGTGVANHLSFKFTNDNGSDNISLKVEILKEDGSSQFVIGSDSAYEVIASGQGERLNDIWESKECSFAKANVVGVRFTVYTTKSGNVYFYMDDLVVDYVEPTPQVTYASINYGFEDRSAGDVSLSDSTWYQDKKDGSSYVALGTSQFKVISSNSGNKFSCMIGGWSQVRRFAYTPTSGTGVANHLSFKFTNDNGSDNISLKVEILKEDGSSQFVIGSDSAYEVIASGQGERLNDIWESKECSFAEANVVGVRFTVYTTKSGNVYFYMDDLVVDYVAPAQTVQYGLVNTDTWDITDAGAEFFAWVWDAKQEGHWIELQVQTDAQSGAKYFVIEVSPDMTGALVARFNPQAANKPTAGSTSFGNYSTEELWNQSQDLVLSGTAGMVNFYFG